MAVSYTHLIDDDSFCRYVIQQDINKIALDLREAHKDDFFSVPEDNPLEDFLQTAEETTSPDSDPEQAAMAFICKRLKLNYGKLDVYKRQVFPSVRRAAARQCFQYKTGRPFFQAGQPVSSWKRTAFSPRCFRTGVWPRSPRTAVFAAASL